jgi:hypothetical protein
LQSSGFEHKTLKCRKFKTGRIKDYWLGTTEIEHSMKENITHVSMKWWFHYNQMRKLKVSNVAHNLPLYMDNNY